MEWATSMGSGQFWGKAEADDEGRPIRWHPLMDHCVDVAACAEALLGLPTWERRLARLAGVERLDGVTRARLCVLTALHDIGKLNHGFQDKIRPGATLRAGHVDEAVALLVAMPVRVAQIVGGAGVCDWDAEGGLALLYAAIGHHGRPAATGGSPATVLWAPRPDRDPLLGLQQLIDALRVAWPEAWLPGPDLPKDHAFGHAFAGLVMLADWLGSDRREDAFRFTEVGDGPRLPFARERARMLLAATGLDAARPRAVVSGRALEFAELVQGNPAITEAQPAQAVIDALPVGPGPSLVLLESETGSGKTEAAFVRFARLFAAGEVDGMYFAVPTRSAAVQLHGRIVRLVRALFGRAAPPVVLAVPGYLKVDESEGRLLEHFKVLWNDDAAERDRYRTWAAENSKRYLAGAVVVGTIDQVLLSALKVPHAHLRATALLRHLLVVDEVHASDAYMTGVLEFVLAHMRDAGGHALLMSATLGGETRETLLASGAPRARSRRIAGLDACIATPYPLVSVAPGSALPVTRGRAEKAVTFQPAPWMDAPERVAEAALAAARQGARVLVIRNTVRACVATQEAVERLGEGEPTLLFGVQTARGLVPAPHHARFSPGDRRILDAAVEAALGGRGPGGPVVVVATQTVEQSLDIDADVLFTDLCPADVLLQRVGRLHRHRRERPPGFERARVVVLVPAEGALDHLLADRSARARAPGLGTVYSDLAVLQATWRAILERPDCAIPADNRWLVEQSLHPEAVARVAVGEAWQRHVQQEDGAMRAQRSVGVGNCVKWSDAYAEGAIPRDETIRSRLSPDGDPREIPLDRAVVSPFGTRLEGVRIPANLAKGLPADARGTVIEATEEGFSFVCGERTFQYGRMGLAIGP